MNSKYIRMMFKTFPYSLTVKITIEKTITFNVFTTVQLSFYQIYFLVIELFVLEFIQVIRKDTFIFI